MRATHWLSGLVAVLSACLPAAAIAQAVGSEFRVNTYTTSYQLTRGDHLVAAAASGDFVVVWSSYGQDGDQNGVFGQRFDSQATAQGEEFRSTPTHRMGKARHPWPPTRTGIRRGLERQGSGR